MSEVLLEAVNLQKSYRVDHNVLEVVKGVDLTVQAGEMLAVVGPSGAGKSTLLHLLGGLDQPTAGSVRLEEQDINKLSDGAWAQMRNQKIGFVFQFYHLIPELTCLENVMLPGMLAPAGAGRAGRQLKQDAGELLAELGLGERARHRPNQLSGGEQQRCAIARALINKPRLLLADEPTGNLDRQTSRTIFELLLKIKKTRDVTMILVTHDEELAGMCPRRISLLDGKLVTSANATRA